MVEGSEAAATAAAVREGAVTAWEVEARAEAEAPWAVEGAIAVIPVV